MSKRAARAKAGFSPLFGYESVQSLSPSLHHERNIDQNLCPAQGKSTRSKTLYGIAPRLKIRWGISTIPSFVRVEFESFHHPLFPFGWLGATGVNHQKRLDHINTRFGGAFRENRLNCILLSDERVWRGYPRYSFALVMEESNLYYQIKFPASGSQSFFSQSNFLFGVEYRYRPAYFVPEIKIPSVYDSKGIRPGLKESQNPPRRLPGQQTGRKERQDHRDGMANPVAREVESKSCFDSTT